MAQGTAIYSPRSLTTKEVTDFIKKTSDLMMVDAFERQLKELIYIEQPGLIGKDKQKVYQSREFKKYVSEKRNDFCYFYYPWNKTLVKCVGEGDYYRLKTNRNRDLITPPEQKKLYDYKVGVFGLSVGSNIASAFSLSGIAKKMVLADPDGLETTNLNRVLAGIHEIGLNKAVIAARKIYEDNPYAELVVLNKGISLGTLKVLLKKKEIECIIEEIDNLPLKIGLRKLARDFKVPVIMITDNGEGVVLHIERYDLGYEKAFEEDFSYWQERFKKPLSQKEIGETITQMIGGVEIVDYRMLQSVKKVFRGKLISWSQLGTAAMLAGVVATLAVKNIVSGWDQRPYVREYINI